MSAADLVYARDDENPGTHSWIKGDPVPQNARAIIKRQGGTYRKTQEAWHLPIAAARVVWAECEALGLTQRHLEDGLAPAPRRRLMECPECKGARWSDDTDPRCGHCGCEAGMVAPPGAVSDSGDPVMCELCGVLARNPRRHCSKS